jgi:hypothetical protein
MDLRAVYSLPRLQEIAARYAVYHVCRLIRSLAKQLEEICDIVNEQAHKAGHKEPPIPYMPEFFEFMPISKREILRKKKWS